MTDTATTASQELAAGELGRTPCVDLYGAAHKGIRWGLSGMLGRLGAADATEPTELARMLDDLEGLLYLCERHAFHEDRALLPALEARRPGASRALETDHQALDSLVVELRALAAWLTRASAEKQTSILRALYLRFAVFVAENLTHMDREEREAQQAFEQLYVRDELLALQGSFLGGIGPEERVAFYRLMLPAASRAERKALLRRIAEHTPAAVVDSLLGDLRGSLSASDHRELREVVAP